jgi:hypothetical protein
MNRATSHNHKMPGEAGGERHGAVPMAWLDGVAVVDYAVSGHESR